MNLKIIPPDYMWIFIGLEILSHFVFPIAKIISFPYRYFGILFILFGMFLNFEVWRIFRKNRTTLKPHETPRVLITSGVFKISRNPIYLGMAGILLGVAILLGSITPFIFPLLFIILTNRLIIPVEEKNLGKVFGKKYLNYKNKIRRWV